jgi:Polyketide cyclase / dehydrase and lipid transport
MHIEKEAAMATLHHIDKSAHTTASPSIVYAVLLDRPSWPSWSPLAAFEPGPDGSDGPRSVGAIGTFVTGRTRSREEVVELIPDRRLSYTLLSGLPLHDYRADVDLTPSASGTDIRWHSTFHARVGTGWAYRFGLGRFIARMVTGLAAEASRRAVTATSDAAR